MWSRIPRIDEKGLRASNRWLRNLEPKREAKRRLQLIEFQQRIEKTLARDQELLRTFRATIQIALLLGRTNGLREGVDLYEYGLRIQDDKTDAYRAVMKYVIKNRDNPEKLAVKEICIYLDKQISRIKNNHGRADCQITPPTDWGCTTWTRAFQEKRNDVDVLFSDAKAEALSEKFALLMAMAAWRGNERRGSGTEQSVGDNPKQTPSIPAAARAHGAGR